MGRVKEGKGGLLGNAGEHYVVAELLRRDIIADRAPRNAPAIDVMATTGPKSVNVRVKTRSDQADSWVWIAKPDKTIFRNIHDKNDFTVLVHISGDNKSVGYWVIPTRILDTRLCQSHTRWENAPGRNGRVRSKTNPMRRIGTSKDDQEWLNQYKGEKGWNLLLASLT